MAEQQESKQLDKRTFTRYLNSGQLDEKAYERYLKGLPDVADKAAPVDTLMGDADHAAGSDDEGPDAAEE